MIDAWIGQSFEQSHWVLTLLLALGGGFLTSLTPCVYPLIPVTLGLMGARQVSSRFEGFLVALTYVSGMVFFYTALGILFAGLGVASGNLLQIPAVLLFVALLFFFLALSMFGAIDWVIPSKTLVRLSKIGGTGYRGAFLMGLVAGVIAAPCTGPVLTFILTIVAAKNDAWFGTMLLLFYGIGLGIPFLILGTFSALLQRIPKSGKWMDGVKTVFGLSMLLVSAYYFSLLSPFVHSVLSQLIILPLILWALVGAAGAIGSFVGKTKLNKLMSKVILSTAFLMLALPLLDPSFRGRPSSQSALEKLNMITLRESEILNEALNIHLKAAQKAGIPVMVDFYADWCTACKELEEYTYPHPQVLPLLSQFQVIKIDATLDGPNLQKLQKRYKILGLPTLLFISKEGRLLLKPRVFGMLAPKEFRKILENILGKH